MVAFFEDDHGARKGGGRTGTFKADTPVQVMDFRRKGQDMPVPPCRIRPGGKQSDHSFSAFHLNFVHSLGHPMRQCPSVGRIHPADAMPDLAQSVIFRREKVLAL